VHNQVMHPRRTQPNGALGEMLAQDGELDRILEGRGLTFESLPASPAQPPPPPPTFPPPDWEEERIERLQREAAEERARVEQEVAAELAKITDDSEEPERYPARPRKRRSWFAKEQS
jgi:hypothetical protein